MLNIEIRKKYFPPVTSSFRQTGGTKTKHSVGRIASALGYSRQIVYKQQKDIINKNLKLDALKRLEDRETKQLPGIYTRKIYHLIKEDLREQLLKFGRDKLLGLIQLYGLQIKPHKRFTLTIMSRHWLKKWPNIIRGKTVRQQDEVWFSDITYTKTEDENCFLNIITDAYSRRIMGYTVD